MADLPHFAAPFRFVNGAAVVFEQDTTDEIMGCVLAVVLCPLGFRVELPDFGVPDPTFTEGAVRVDVLEAALAEWEPRAHQDAEAWPDALDAFVSHVLVRVATSSED
jgi:phage baseplate assembly protein W